MIGAPSVCLPPKPLQPVTDYDNETMSYRGRSRFFLALVTTAGLDLLVFLTRPIGADVGHLSLAVGLALQAFALLWIAWATDRRHYLQPGALPWMLILIGCYSALWAFHYQECHRIKLFDEGRCALPRTEATAGSSSNRSG